MTESTATKLHAQLFEVRKEITALAKDKANSERVLELVKLQEKLEAELVALRGDRSNG